MLSRQLLRMQFQRRFDENYRTGLKIVVVMAVLLISISIAFIDNMRILIIPAIAVVGIAAILLFMRQPPIGILLMIFSTLLLPAPLASSTSGSFNPAMFIQLILLGLWVLDMAVHQHRIHLAPSRTNLPLVLLLVWTTISLINGQINYYFVPKLAPLDAQVGQIMIYILSGVAFLLAGNRMMNTVWLRRSIWLFVILSALYIFGRLIHPIRHYVLEIYQYGSYAAIFWVWLIAILSSQLLLNRQLSKPAKLALGAVLVGTLDLALIWGYSWKSGWLPGLVAVAVIIFVGFPKLRAIALFMGIFVLIMGSGRIEKLVSGGEDYSLSTREEASSLYFEIVKINPILGLGPANVYWYTPLFPIRGYSINYNSHNNYIDIITQFGIIGLALFLWFVWEIGKVGWKLKDAVHDPFERAYVVGALGGLVGMVASGFLGDWFFPFVYNVGMVSYRSSMLGWLFLGGLVFLEQLYLKKQNIGVTQRQ